MKKSGGILGKPISRRSVLKGGAAIAGTTAVTGFPMVWAQTIKDVTLNHTGMSYSTIADIARQASTGSRLQGRDVGGRSSRASRTAWSTIRSSIDIADMEIWQTKVAVPQGVTQAVEIAKIKNWAKLTPLYTEGMFAGKEVSRQGDSPIEFMYRDAVDATTFASGKTDWATFVPSVYNADTLGIRPDLVGREITSWADLISPDFKGKTAIQNIPTIGIMDAIMALEAAGEIKYGDKGNPTQDELDQDDRAADRAEEGRPFPRAVEHVRREREPDGGRRGGHPVDVVAGGHRGAEPRHQMRLPAAQGRLSRLGQRPGADGASRRHASATRPTSTSTGTIPAGSAASSPSRATTAPMSRRPRRP